MQNINKPYSLVWTKPNCLIKNLRYYTSSSITSMIYLGSFAYKHSPSVSHTLHRGRTGFNTLSYWNCHSSSPASASVHFTFDNNLIKQIYCHYDKFGKKVIFYEKSVFSESVSKLRLPSIPYILLRKKNRQAFQWKIAPMVIIIFAIRTNVGKLCRASALSKYSLRRCVFNTLPNNYYSFNTLLQRIHVLLQG